MSAELDDFERTFVVTDPETGRDHALKVAPMLSGCYVQSRIFIDPEWEYGATLAHIFREQGGDHGHIIFERTYVKDFPGTLKMVAIRHFCESVADDQVVRTAYGVRARIGIVQAVEIFACDTLTDAFVADARSRFNVGVRVVFPEADCLAPPVVVWATQRLAAIIAPESRAALNAEIMRYAEEMSARQLQSIGAAAAQAEEQTDVIAAPPTAQSIVFGGGLKTSQWLTDTASELDRAWPDYKVVFAPATQHEATLAIDLPGHLSIAVPASGHEAARVLSMAEVVDMSHVAPVPPAALAEVAAVVAQLGKLTGQKHILWWTGAAEHVATHATDAGIGYAAFSAAFPPGDCGGCLASAADRERPRELGWVVNAGRGVVRGAWGVAFERRRTGDGVEIHCTLSGAAKMCHEALFGDPMSAGQHWAFPADSGKHYLGRLELMRGYSLGAAISHLTFDRFRDGRAVGWHELDKVASRLLPSATESQCTAPRAASVPMGSAVPDYVLDALPSSRARLSGNYDLLSALSRYDVERQESQADLRGDGAYIVLTHALSKFRDAGMWVPIWANWRRCLPLEQLPVLLDDDVVMALALGMARRKELGIALHAWELQAILGHLSHRCDARERRIWCIAFFSTALAAAGRARSPVNSGNRVSDWHGVFLHAARTVGVNVPVSAARSRAKPSSGGYGSGLTVPPSVHSGGSGSLNWRARSPGYGSSHGDASTVFSVARAGSDAHYGGFGGDGLGA